MRILDDRATQKVAANGLELACQVYAPAARAPEAAMAVSK